MMKKCALAVTLIFTLSIISGCTNIKDDSTRTKTESTLLGTGIGAAVGAGLGAILGGDKGALVGAGIGAALGAAGGYAYGDHVAGQKKNYASTEDWLDACVADAQKANQAMTAYNQELNSQIVTLQNDTATLKEKYKTAKTRQDKLKEKQSEVDQLLAKANTQLDSAKKELEAQQFVAGEAKKENKNAYAVTLDSEVEGLKANITELEKRTKDLASLSASMSV